jgi:regulatory protein
MASSRKRNRASARDAALTWIAQRQHSEHEIRARLERRGYPEAECEDAVRMLREYRYLDDQAVAAAVVREAERAGRGPEWIRHTLSRRGLPEELETPSTEEGAAVAPVQARTLVQQRFGDPRALPLRDRRRAFRFLVGRGFSAECALDVLGENT